MSPLHLRRYRAERLLRSEFEGLRGQVLGPVRRKLAAANVALAEADLEACYAQAWQGLYATVLAGEQIDNPAGWLVTAAFRRAIDEHQARSRQGGSATDAPEPIPAVGSDPIEAVGSGERDFAAALDDRMRLRQLLQGISGQMSERERQAVALCCLQGLSRAQAASRMGIGARRMERLMDGRGHGKPGATAKLGALVETIAAGRFCEQQASLMRALAFGVLDPAGERHRLAIAHQRSCPACRAYVLQLRGLAATLPPVLLPTLLRLLGRARLPGGARSPAGAARSLRTRWRPRPGAGSHPAGPGLGSLATSKLAVTGLVIVGAGVGVATLVTGANRHNAPARGQPRPATAARSSSVVTAAPEAGARARRRAAKARGGHRAAAGGAKRPHARSRSIAAPTTPAQREFSFERVGAAGSDTPPAPGAPRASGAPLASGTSPTAGAPPANAGAGAQALREFGIE